MGSGYGPAERVLMATVARRYYLDGRSKTEIATALGMSRSKVAGLLHRAQADRFVRIEISSPARLRRGAMLPAGRLAERPGDP